MFSLSTFWLRIERDPNSELNSSIDLRTPDSQTSVEVFSPVPRPSNFSGHAQELLQCMLVGCIIPCCPSYGLQQLLAHESIKGENDPPFLTVKLFLLRQLTLNHLM
ncbi:TPA: hypothetical protein ACH3X3_004991 [Trebouxia sp. C0006]